MKINETYFICSSICENYYEVPDTFLVQVLQLLVQ